MKVWLDDDRPSPIGFVHVKTPAEVIALLRTGKVTELSLDHDLALVDDGGCELTGYDVLAWLERELSTNATSVPLPRISIHSANPPARQRILAAVKAIERLSVVRP